MFLVQLGVCDIMFLGPDLYIVFFLIYVALDFAIALCPYKFLLNFHVRLIESICST